MTTDLADRICSARDAGKSDAEILRDNADELTALLSAPSFVAIAVTVLPLVVSIAKEIKGGKKIGEVLLSRAGEIIETVLTVLPLFVPAQTVKPVVAPIVPR